MIVAIHQPNFFPWLGWFDKLARCDHFCLLDDAQFPKKGGTWINRVQLVNNGHVLWATAPVKRGFPGVQTICETQINDAEPWRTKLLQTLRSAYGKAPFFREVFPFVQPLVEHPTENLCQLNLHALGALCEALGLDAGKFVRSSALAVPGEATERLIGIVKALGGSTYLCGGGAAGYQEDEAFAACGLALAYQRFAHPVYPQTGPFTAGLSILDALMCCGFDGTAALLTKNPRAAAHGLAG